ncbi:tetratricopeptide repeat protein [Actinoplanes sp. CA-252034]|uniref:tetratricopeptide repeat protein n=1 Tax=Actinoplanes sp. CA-252034 TaxID=3239906 RepID=UPI003D9816E8
MLNARFAVVDFTGRDRERAELRAWCDLDTRSAARWLHGPGGQGKTRLAARLAADCRAAGWSVVTATPGVGTVLPPPGSQDLRTDGAAGLLLIVDYAELWPLSHLAWLFSNALLHRDALPTRVLLQARTADAWPAVRGILANDRTHTSAQHLTGLPDTGDARARMFAAARDGFAARYGIDDPDVIGPPDAQGDGLTLAVHVAALVAVDAHARGVRPPTDQGDLTAYLLDREHAYWARTGGENLERVVFTAALTGALPRAEGRSVLDALALAPELLDAHAASYPPPDPARDTVLEPLFPDRLAEDFVALSLPGHRGAHPAKPWAPSVLRTVLGHGGRGLGRLVAAAERWPHVAAGHLYPLLHDTPQLAADAGSPVLTALANLPDLPTELIADVSGALPPSTPADLDTGVAALGARRSREHLARPDEPAAHARTRVNLAGFLGRLGRSEEALAALEEAAGAWRGLGPEHTADLAATLTNLGNARARAGRSAEALGALLEAVEINRAGGQERDLALTLSNLGGLYMRTGREADAVAVLSESVTVYQRLTDEAGLAVALGNLGGALAGAGRADEAVEPTRRAVRIWRRLADQDPDAYEAALALALGNLTAFLRDAGGPGDRLPVVEEAVTILRRLATANPSAYRENHAVALGLYAEALSRPGRVTEALDAAREGAAARRDLARESPTTGRVLALAEALRRLGRIATLAGRHGEAAAANAEADTTEQRFHAWLDGIGVPHHMAPPEVVNRAAPDGPPPPPGEPEQEPLPWRPAAEILRAGRDLAREKSWPRLWELIRSVPITEACELARHLPPGHSVLAARLAGTRPPRVRPDPGREMPFVFGHPDQVAFAADGGALVVKELVMAPDRGYTLHVHEPAGSRVTELYRGPADHLSFAGPARDQVVALRSGLRDPLVLYRNGLTDPLLPGVPLDVDCTVIATASGVVLGLGSAPAAYVGGDPRAMRYVNLSGLGLWRASVLAADGTGTMVAVSDGSVLAVTDERLRRHLGAAAVPESLGTVAEAAFAGPATLFTAGTRGGLVRWRLDVSGLRPEAAVDTPGLTGLFVVPAWRAVGGWAFSEGRAYLLDSGTLRRIHRPPAVPSRGLMALKASPDGRYVVMGGHLPPPGGHRWSAPKSRTVLHDLHQPAAWLARPLASILAAELPSLERVLAEAPAALRPVLALIRDMAAREHGLTA